MATNQTMDHVLITDDDQGPILAIATWFLMTVMVLAVVAQVTIKITVRRQLRIEDFLVMAALFFGVAQSVAVSLAIKYGLGQRQLNLDSLNLLCIEKAQYVADLMYVLAIALAKVSILQLLRALAVSKIHRKVAEVSIYIVIAWAIPVFFTLAFQCGVPQPWASLTGQCINKFAFWAAISPVDILTELVAILLPIFMMMPVQVSLAKKVAVVVAFSFRIAVIVTTIVRLVLLHTYFSSGDLVFNSIANGITTQCLLSAAITTACVPSLKPFLDGFESGMLGVTIKPSEIFSGKSYEMNNSNSGNKTAPQSQSRDWGGGGGYLAAIGGQKAESSHDKSESLDSGKSNAMIIKRTDQWEIRYESGQASSMEPTEEFENRI